MVCRSKLKGSVLLYLELARLLILVGLLCRVLVVEDGGNVYALANKCVHMGLPLQGKTGLFQAKVRIWPGNS